jgi:hypothetical protein
MASQLVSVSRAVHVTVRKATGGTSPALLLALRFDEPAGETLLFVATRHHGVEWVEPSSILEAWAQ